MNLVTNIVGEVSFWSLNFNFNAEKNDDSFSIIYQKIIGDKAYELLTAFKDKPDPNAVMGRDARSFEIEGLFGLRECGCTRLARTETNQWRQHFESAVIQQIEPINNVLESSLPIRITAIATGFLFGEWVLLCKLINHLSTKSINRDIHLNCIDKSYKRINLTSQKKSGMERELNDAITSFSTAMKKIISLSDVIFKGCIQVRLFKSDQDYISWVKQSTDPNEQKYDLLIGADRGNTDSEIKELWNLDGLESKKSIFLEVGSVTDVVLRITDSVESKLSFKESGAR